MTTVDPPAVPTATGLPPEVVRMLQQWREVIRRLLERTGGPGTDKLAYLTVTQDVDLDTMETDVSASKAITDFITITQAVDLDTVESDVVTLQGRTLTAGTGLSGGGDLSADRTFTTNDSQIVHDNLSGYVANEHIDHSTVTLTAGNGLTGGGDISSSRSFAIARHGEGEGHQQRSFCQDY